VVPNGIMFTLTFMKIDQLVARILASISESADMGTGACACMHTYGACQYGSGEENLFLWNHNN
jgi:hypothetical protein